MVSYGSEELRQQGRSDQYTNVHSMNKASVAKVGVYKKPSTNGQQPKVYKVKPIHFRELVQKLTGAAVELLPQSQPPPPAQPRRKSLQSIAPPPLPLQHHHQNQIHTGNYANVQAPHQQPSADQKSSLDTTELTLSPNFQAWFSFANLLSPGPATISQMEQRSVL